MVLSTPLYMAYQKKAPIIDAYSDYIKIVGV